MRLVKTGITGIILLILVTACLSYQGVKVVGESSSVEIDRLVEEKMQAGKIPGVALVIVKGDKIDFLKGYGIAGPDQRPVTPQTPFQLGSISRAITALAILQLVEAGKINLDAPVQNYLPWFRTSNERESAEVTVRQLLNQTSGFSRTEGTKWIGRNDQSETALQTVVRELKDAKLAFKPGTSWAYSEVNYAILGLIIQTVSGMNYERYVNENIFKPLEMTHAYTNQTEAEGNGLATGYRYWFNQAFPMAEVPYPRGLAPDEGLIASAEDLGKLLITELNQGQYNGKQVLSSKGIIEMHRPAVQTQDSRWPYYGMGWKINNIDGDMIVSNTGDTAGYHAEVILDPEKKWGIGLLMNSSTLLSPAWEPIHQLGSSIADLVAGKKVTGEVGAISRQYLLILGLEVFLVVLQVIRFVRWLKKPRQWWNNPQMQPKDVRGWMTSIGLPLIFDLFLAWLFLIGLPSMLGLPIHVILLIQPDIGWLAAFLGWSALIWGVTRTTLYLLILWFPKRKKEMVSEVR
jgi:CubicO group peptidase (beta-lactamase class C family)